MNKVRVLDTLDSIPVGLAFLLSHAAGFKTLEEFIEESGGMDPEAAKTLFEASRYVKRKAIKKD